MISEHGSADKQLALYRMTGTAWNRLVRLPAHRPLSTGTSSEFLQELHSKKPRFRHRRAKQMSNLQTAGMGITGDTRITMPRTATSWSTSSNGQSFISLKTILTFWIERSHRNRFSKVERSDLPFLASGEVCTVYLRWLTRLNASDLKIKFVKRKIEQWHNFLS